MFSPSAKQAVHAIVKDISIPFGWTILIDRDKKDARSPSSFGGGFGRVYLQIEDKNGTCNVTGEPMPWRGRKWYLSEHMTDTEIVNTCWLAFEIALRHEAMEQFRYCGVSIFNPHVSTGALVSINSNPYNEQHRKERPKTVYQNFCHEIPLTTGVGMAALDGHAYTPAAVEITKAELAKNEPTRNGLPILPPSGSLDLSPKRHETDVIIGHEPDGTPLYGSCEDA